MRRMATGTCDTPHTGTLYTHKMHDVYVQYTMHIKAMHKAQALYCDVYAEPAGGCAVHVHRAMYKACVLRCTNTSKYCGDLWATAKYCDVNCYDF